MGDANLMVFLELQTILSCYFPIHSKALNLKIKEHFHFTNFLCMYMEVNSIPKTPDLDNFKIPFKCGGKFLGYKPIFLRQ